MAKIISAAEAAELINDGDSVVFAADGLVCFPNELVDAVEQRYLKGKTSCRHHKHKSCRYGKLGRRRRSPLVS